MEVVFIAEIKKGKGCWEIKTEIPFASKNLKEAEEFLKDKGYTLDSDGQYYQEGSDNKAVIMGFDVWQGDKNGRTHKERTFLQVFAY